MKSLKTQILLIAALVVTAGAALYFGLSGNSAPAEPQKVVLIKYSDYQCPACKFYHDINEQLKGEFGDMVEFQYRYFPLDGFEFSRDAAYSVEAAKRQGKFQEMHNRIFDTQEQWSKGDAMTYFRSFAEEFGLDMEQFEADIVNPEVMEEVARQRTEGRRRLVNATPTYFINGQKLQQLPQGLEQFRSIVELYMYRSDR